MPSRQCHWRQCWNGKCGREEVWGLRISYELLKEREAALFFALPP